MEDGVQRQVGRERESGAGGGGVGGGLNLHGRGGGEKGTEKETTVKR